MIHYNEYTINKSDYKFYADLSADEKLWFIYDLICTNEYGIGSVDVKPPAKKELLQDFNLIVDEYEDQLRTLVNSTIRHDQPINILIVNKFVVLNSNDIELIDDEIFDMFYNGFMLMPYNISRRATNVFQHQDICVVYEIIGKESKLCEN